MFPSLVPHYPAAAILGNLYERDQSKEICIAWIMSRFHAFDLIKLGVNANYLPVLDIPVAGEHDVIGTCAYAKDLETVTALGCAAAIRGFWMEVFYR
ncbi:hypothetical protein [Bartonella henselae]|uniref:hypothetical protein n=1 Tax=Bartonella henselae TaxID=38323 RepID=UPI000A9B51A9|nr:hypothetical protein [Bartonella henselae]